MAAFISEVEKLDSANKKYTIDDICKSYREENKKKDEIIQQLCRINPPSAGDLTAAKHIHSHPKNELVALEVKISNLEEKIRSKQNEIDSKNEQLAILKKECEIYHLEAEKFDNDNRKLITSNKRLEESIETYESLKYRSEYTIRCLQEQYQQSQSRVGELEARIKNHLTDKEKVDQSKATIESKHQNFIIKLANLVSVSDFSKVDDIIDKLSQMAEQNALLNGKLHSLEQRAVAAEDDAKGARETVVKLMKDYESSGQNKDNLREAKTLLEAEKADLKNEIELLKKRLESLQKLFDTAKGDLELKANQVLNGDLKLKEQQFATQTAQTMLTSLLESLAAIIGTPFSPCTPTESCIKERTKQMVQKLKEQNSVAEVLDQRVLMLQKQFENQYETGKELLSKTKDADQIKQELENKIKSLENDVAAQEILKDNMKCEKERLIRSIYTLADLLAIDYLPSDQDAIGLLGLLSERCKEIMANQVTGIFKCARCTGMKNDMSEVQKQSKRISSLKEELEAKELQIKLLEKRLGQQGTAGDSLQSCRYGGESSRDRVHRLQHHLEESQLEIEDLRRALIKSQSNEYEFHKIEKQKQIDELDQLTSTVEKLDKVRQKQAKKIVGLRSQIEEKDHLLSHKSQTAKDLKQARYLLEETRCREIKLLDFRDYVARILGVDVRCSADPEAEIKGRIQRIMSMAQSAVSTPFTPYYCSQDLGSHFQTGYNNKSVSSNASNGIPPASNPRSHLVSFDEDGSTFSKRQQIPKNKITFQSNCKPKMNRARSTSPTKVDERKY